MAIINVSNTRVRGIAACVPKKEESNYDYELTSEKERHAFIKMTGIETRRVAEEGVTTSDLCYQAAEKLISDLQWDKEEIDALVFISQSGDYILPATGIILQDRLGLPKTTMAFDINLGCSGYIYGLAQLGSLISTGGIRKALMLVGDVSTATSSYRDKSTYLLFGDAGTATALEYDKEAPDMNFNLQSDGAGYDAIIIPEGGLRNFVSEDSFKYKDYGNGMMRNGIQVALNGEKVFHFSMREVAPNIRELLENQLGKTLDDVDYYVLHQANMLMNNSIRRKLKQGKDKFPNSIHRYGNTSSASVPLTIVTQLKEALTNQTKNLILSGFGVGLSWGSVYLHVENMVIPELIEV
ncbi:MAG TPA: ketoacyl-ACP synthase III [Bacteroidales bacterium]|nr:ketoacyl-ACP synthase III [Bacteroidales bacterium]